jgi:CheY-like chemotaxis protein
MREMMMSREPKFPLPERTMAPDIVEHINAAAARNRRKTNGETMIAITVFNGLYCNDRQVVERIANTIGYRVVTDSEVLSEAAGLSGLPEDGLAGVFPCANRETPELAADHGEILGWLRLAMARMLSERRDLIFHGYAAHLLPPRMEHVLRVCLVSPMRDRMQEGARYEQRDGPDLRDSIFADDVSRAEWVMAHTDCNDPWDRRLYDLVLPVASLGVRQSACRVVEQLCSAAMQHTRSSRESLDEFLLEAEAQAKLSRWGSCVSVVAKGRSLTLAFNDNKMVLDGMIGELRELLSGIDGVQGVRIGVGGSYNEADVYTRPEGLVSAQNRAGCVSGDNGDDVLHHEPADSGRGDSALAAEVRAALSRNGYPVSVRVDDGFVSLAIMSHAEMLRVIARKLCTAVSDMEGVEIVDVGMVRTYHKTPAYRGLRRKAASRILREDAREFSPFLSERLRTGGKVSIALYDGERAWNADFERKPEVILLDADLPGVDGVEAVRRVRLDNPGAKVLVLSGIGLERDRQGYLDMDVSAYLNKPVTAAVLGDAIRGAAGIPCSTS